ncbi:MAG TPA: hypothetical protein PKK12_05870 [Candidatus Aminicenantes bacterium]|nr:hypothetical protein [Candidatus Aminicenantes bacterium]
MLRKLLGRLAQGGAHTLDHLALDLGIERGEVETMLAQLGTLGYLEELTVPPVAGCHAGGTAAAACRDCRGCVLASRGRLWSLTDKGRSALSRPDGVDGGKG